MAVWIRDLSLKYKFWALNMVTFVIALLLVLYAVQLEQSARSADAVAAERRRVRHCWRVGRPMLRCRRVRT